MNSLLMTPAKFAARRGVQKSAVSNWKKKGWLVYAEGPDGGKPLIDVERSELKLNANLDPSRGRPTTGQMTAVSDLPVVAPAPPQNSGLTDVRTDLIKAQTVGKTLENARRAGELVVFAEFERLAIENGRVTRERMIALARNLSERLAAEREPRQVSAILIEEIDKAFTELAEQITRGDTEDDAAALDAIENAEHEVPGEVPGP